MNKFGYEVGDAVQEQDDWAHLRDDCGHIAIVSISETECQCMDCLRIWPKKPGFKSDFPQMDRG